MSPDDILELLTWLRAHQSQVVLVQLLGHGTSFRMHHPKHLNYTTRGLVFAQESDIVGAANVTVMFEHVDRVIVNDPRPHMPASAELRMKDGVTFFINLAAQGEP